MVYACGPETTRRTHGRPLILLSLNIFSSMRSLLAPFALLVAAAPSVVVAQGSTSDARQYGAFRQSALAIPRS